MKNTQTRVKTKVYEMQLKLDRNQTAKTKTCAFTLNESNLRIHSNIMYFFFYYLNCIRYNVIDLVTKIRQCVYIVMYSILVDPLFFENIFVRTLFVLRVLNDF